MDWKAECVTGDDWVVTLNGRRMGQVLPRADAKQVVRVLNNQASLDSENVYGAVKFLDTLSSEDHAFLLGVMSCV